MRRLLPTTAAILAFALACGPASTPPPDDVTTDLPIPTTLQPPEKNVASYPASDTSSPYPERLVTAFGDVPGGLASVSAKGYVAADLDTVVAAVREVDPIVDRRRVARWAVQRGTDATVAESYDLTNTVEDLATFDYVTLWRGTVRPADGDVPPFAAFRSRLKESNFFMTSIDDSIVLLRVNDSTTAIELVRDTKTAATDERDAEQYLKDLYDSLVARAHGRPLPTY